MVFIVNFIVSVSEVCHWMGLNSLKPKQLEAICKFVSGRNAFVALPTGYVPDFNKQPKAYKSKASVDEKYNPHQNNELQYKVM